jgi:hypothetical protein
LQAVDRLMQPLHLPHVAKNWLGSKVSCMHQRLRCFFFVKGVGALLLLLRDSRQ